MEEEKEKFTEETIKSIEKLGEVLRKIHLRLLSERKIRVDKNRKIVFLDK